MSRKGDTGVLAQALALAIFPTVVRLSSIFSPWGLLLLLPFWFVILQAIAAWILGGLHVPWRGRAALAWAVGAVMGLAFLVWAFSSGTGFLAVSTRGIYIATLVLFPLSALRWMQDSFVSHRLWLGALLSLPIFLAINAALFLAGFFPHPQVYGTALMLGAVGIPHDRIVFPLASGVNNFGGIGGATLTVGIVWACLGTPKRNWAMVPLALGIFVVLLTDNRGALIFALLISLVVLALRFLKLTPLSLVFLLIPLAPLLSMAAIRLPLESGIALTRDASDVETLGGRLPIWELTMAHVGGSVRTFLFGHGLDGHISSGAAAAIAPMFSESDPNRFTHTPHNFLLQALLDFGVVGTTVFCVALVVGLRALLQRRPNAVQATAGATLLYFAVSGTVDGHLMPELQDSFPFAILFLTLSLAGRGRASNLAEWVRPSPVSMMAKD